MAPPYVRPLDPATTIAVYSTLTRAAGSVRPTATPLAHHGGDTMGLAERTPPTAEEYAHYPQRFSNWGRWGADDELGTLNLITPEVRRAAAACVVDGTAVGCGRPLNTA